MNAAAKTLTLTILCLAAGMVAAQQAAVAPTPGAGGPSAAVKAPKRTAQSEAGEPRADTSGSSSTATPAASAPPASAQATARTAPAAAAGSRQKSSSATDKLSLGTATVTGSQEQPKVMYIVPWKRSDIGDLAGKPMNSLVDEILAPVDRDVFKREVIYYRAVQADASQNGASDSPSQQGEK